jgi:hypothetical protein
MRDISQLVAKNLYFDMAGGRHEAFDIHITIAKRRPRFRLAAVVRLLNIFETADNAHPATASSRHGFDDDCGVRAFRPPKGFNLVKGCRSRGTG